MGEVRDRYDVEPLDFSFFFRTVAILFFIIAVSLSLSLHDALFVSLHIPEECVDAVAFLLEGLDGYHGMFLLFFVTEVFVGVDTQNDGHEDDEANDRLQEAA